MSRWDVNTCNHPLFTEAVMWQQHDGEWWALPYKEWLRFTGFDLSIRHGACKKEPVGFDKRRLSLASLLAPTPGQTKMPELQMVRWGTSNIGDTDAVTVVLYPMEEGEVIEDE